MDDATLEALLHDLESDRVERKASFTSPDKIRQAVCAFANDLPGHGQPGVLFIGAHDNGSCAHLPIPDELLRSLADIRSDGNIVPFPALTVQKRTIGGCELAVLVVEPSDAPPVRLRGRVWIRVGPRRAVASPQEERQLNEKRRSKDLPFDLRTMPSAAVEDLDLDLFTRTYLPAVVDTDVLEENARSTPDQLASTRMTDTEAVPTVLGILTIGRDPRALIPGDYVQFLRIDGNELGDPIRDQKEIDGPIPELLRRLDDILGAHVSTAVDLSEATEIRSPDYPVAALQQLARNGVLHRTYEGTHSPVRITWFSDRIEIQSPGGPYGQVNRNNFGEPGVTDYRNPHLAEAMKALGYVQRFGVGLAIARRELERNGNPIPEFQIEDTHVLAIVRRRS